MESSTENNIASIGEISLEDYLGPPKYDGLGILMVIISSFIAGFVSGVIILLLSYVSIGKFSFESGASPILLAMLTFFGLIAGNFVYYFFISRVWPEVYSRGRTAVSQIAIASILLYILFAPVYLIVPHFGKDSSIVLIPFALHILFNVFVFHILIGIISTYRYSVLVLFASIASFLLTGCLLVVIYSTFTNSSIALFLLLGLVIVAQVVSSAITFLLLGLYSFIYRSTGFDPIGNIFSRVESEEKALEQSIEARLTQF